MTGEQPERPDTRFTLFPLPFDDDYTVDRGTSSEQKEARHGQFLKKGPTTSKSHLYSIARIISLSLSLSLLASYRARFLAGVSALVLLLPGQAPG